MQRGAALAAVALAASCHYRYLEPASMPVVQVTTTKGVELGVTTDDGVLFLGRTTGTGPAKVLYWIGSSPIVEAGAIQPVGGPIYEVRLDVDLPTVPISFEAPEAGEPLVLMAIEDGRPLRREVRAAEHDFVAGTITTWPTDLEVGPRLLGAGVFRENEAGLALVGLVKATARVEGGARMLVLAGLRELRYAMYQPRTAVPEREVLYRADGSRTIREKRK